MKNYKVINIESGQVQILTEEVLITRIKNMKGTFSDNYIESLITEDTIIDRLNRRKFCWLDIIFTFCLTSVVLLIIYELSIC